MTATDIIIGLAFLIIAVIAYFVTKRRNNITGLPKLTSSPVSIFDRLAADHVNLSPGIRIPRSGNYECIICAKGGFQDTTTSALFGPMEAQKRLEAQKPTMQFFDQDSIFPQCPNCGDTAVWSLLK